MPSLFGSKTMEEGEINVNNDVAIFVSDLENVHSCLNDGELLEPEFFGFLIFDNDKISISLPQDGEVPPNETEEPRPNPTEVLEVFCTETNDETEAKGVTHDLTLLDEFTNPVSAPALPRIDRSSSDSSSRTYFPTANDPPSNYEHSYHTLKTYVCKYCKKKFTLRNIYKRHMRLHKSIKNIPINDITDIPF